MEDDIDELLDSDFSKSSARVFDIIYNEKDVSLPSSKLFDLIEILQGGGGV